MIKMGASVVEVTGCGGVGECANHELHGALPHDIACAICGTLAFRDHSRAAARSPGIPGGAGKSQHPIA